MNNGPLARPDRDYPARPIIAVGALVWKGPDLLMIRRGKPPRAGEWSLPGGAQELGETLEEAVHREVLEETGVEIDILDLVAAVDSLHRDADGHLVNHYSLIDYTALWRAGEPRPGADELAARFVTPEERAALSLWSVTRDVIARSWRQVEHLDGGDWDGGDRDGGDRDGGDRDGANGGPRP